MHRNESYSIHQLDHHLHSTTQLTTTSSLNPHYDNISPKGQDTDDVIIDYNRSNKDEHVRVEASKKNGEESEELQDYEMPVTSWGVMDEGYTQ